jgi:hypothetical protein
MNYLWNEFKDKLKTYLICSFIFAAMPWMKGPYMLDVTGIFLVTCLLWIAYVFARTVWLTFYRRLPTNGK